jgi:hypothetical protein
MKNSLSLIVLSICFTFVTFRGQAQKVEREYYPNFRVKYEWQVNANGVKNGYFKSFATDGVLYEKGFYTNGKKSGLWTSYGIMQGYPGEISSTMEYEDGQMNGRYLQYCWNHGKRYTCGDYVYKEGNEIQALQYHDNGILQYRRDREKGINEEFFSDGTPSRETKDGKMYTYDKSYQGKYVSLLVFDTLDMVIRCSFSSDHRLSTIYLNTKSDKCFDCGDAIVSFGLSNLYKPNVYKNSKEITLDSSYCHQAYSYYVQSPNPNNKKEVCPYDFETGDIKELFSDGAYVVYHIGPDGNESYRKYYNSSNQITQEKDISGVISKYSKGIIQKQTGPNDSWTKDYNDKGILVKDENHLYTTEFYDADRPKMIAGYVNGMNNPPVYEVYHPSGRLKYSRGLNPLDTTKLVDYTFEYADSEAKSMTAILYFTSFSTKEFYRSYSNHVYPNSEERNPSVIRERLINLYRSDIKSYDRKVMDVLCANYTYPKGELAFKKAYKLFSSQSAIIAYSTDFNLIKEAFEKATYIVLNMNKIQEPTSEEEMKMLKKSKDEQEIFRLLKIAAN